jgi:hypothetical protein
VLADRCRLMPMLKTRQLSLTPVGEGEEATAEETLGLGPARLVGVEVTYTEQPGTTVVTITSLGRTILTLEGNTSGFFQLAAAVDDATGAAISGASSQSPLVGSITAAVAQGNAVSEGIKLTFFAEV